MNDPKISGIAALNLKDPSLFRQQCYVDGKWADADSGKTLPVNNPATGEILGTVPNMGAAEARRAIEAANAAFPAWRAKTAKERRILEVEGRDAGNLGVVHGRLRFGNGTADNGRKRGNSTANRAVLQDPLQAAVVRPDRLPRLGGWNRLPSDWQPNPLTCRAERGPIPRTEKQA